jgi:aspartyl protease family protein
VAGVLQQLQGLNTQRRTTVCAALGAVLAVLAPDAASSQVVLSGRMGDRALLVVDGRPLTVDVGQQAGGVKLLRWVGDAAEVDAGSGSVQLRIGGTPALVGEAAPRAAARELVITAGPGGHFTAGGAINGHAVSFLVDTGATLVSLGQDQAERLGIDLSLARPAVTQTANGPVPVQLVTLNTVRVGGLELSNVGAAVLPMPMPVVLLGNSFLARLQMRRDNDVMRLERR